MKKVLLLLTAGAVLAFAGLGTAATLAKSYTVKAHLNGAADKTSSKGQGEFTGKYVEKGTGATLTWKLTFTGLTGPALQAHIHYGKKGVSGNVAVALCAPCKSGVKGTAKITAKIIKAMESGGAYVNVHTAKFPNGEIRGQIKVTG
jgi:hypothetical protein